MGKEKKEIGKLIELLNEYEPYIQKDGEKHDNIWYFVYKGGSAIFPKNVGESVIISKSYGFIKWLVENDKINKHGIPEFYTVSDHCLECVYEGIADNTIMLLSIQKNPIDFLCSLLK